MNQRPADVSHKNLYRPDIDGLRALAVLSVVVFHTFPSMLPGGFVGVDVFFVISGFLISQIILSEHQSGRFSYATFYGRRIRRLFPGLLLVIAFSLVAGWILLFPAEYERLGKHVIASSIFLVNFSLLSESGYFDTLSHSKPLLHLWSLSIEEQFYILWPAFLAIAWKDRRRTSLWLWIAFLGSFAFNVFLIDRDRVATFFWPVTRFWELQCGVLLTYICEFAGNADSRKRFFEQHGGVLSASGLGLIMMSLSMLNSQSAFPGYWALASVLGATLLIAAGSRAPVNRLILCHPILVWTGLISYPLYLWHWVLLSFLRIEKLGAPSPLARIIAVTLSFVLAWLTFRYFERPVRTSRASTRRGIGITLLAILAFEAGIGLLIYAGRGFPGRFSDVVTPLLSFRYDSEYEYRNGTCLLSGEQVKFAAECSGETAFDNPAGTQLLIWGDSHAAQYYRAFEELGKERGFRIAQYTSSSCPPVVEFSKRDRPHCLELNQFIQSRIVAIRPRVVVLSHDWPQSWAEGSLDHLAATVKFLRINGVKDILLIGPVPHWRGKLVDILVREVERNHLNAIPRRLSTELDSSIEAIDANLSALAKELQISYVSPLDRLCDGTGCLTLSDSGIPTALDHAHLTLNAARVVLEDIPIELLTNRNP